MHMCLHVYLFLVAFLIPFGPTQSECPFSVFVVFEGDLFRNLFQEAIVMPEAALFIQPWT